MGSKDRVRGGGFRDGGGVVEALGMGLRSS